MDHYVQSVSAISNYDDMTSCISMMMLILLLNDHTPSIYEKTIKAK